MNFHLLTVLLLINLNSDNNFYYYSNDYSDDDGYRFNYLLVGILRKNLLSLSHKDLVRILVIHQQIFLIKKNLIKFFFFFRSKCVILDSLTNYPLYVLYGGRIILPLAKRQYLPIATTTA